MNLASEWIARGVSRLRTTESPDATAGAKAPATVRTTHERLKATLRRGEEVLPPRMLRRLMEDLQAASA